MSGFPYQGADPWHGTCRGAGWQGTNGDRWLVGGWRNRGMMEWLGKSWDRKFLDACDTIWWYDMIWYDMIWYDMIWYDMIWYDMIWYDDMINDICLNCLDDIFFFKEISFDPNGQNSAVLSSLVWWRTWITRIFSKVEEVEKHGQ